jgi:predicted xylose isomerase-like sugar epimerase
MATQITAPNLTLSQDARLYKNVRLASVCRGMDTSCEKCVEVVHNAAVRTRVEQAALKIVIVAADSLGFPGCR